MCQNWFCGSSASTKMEGNILDPSNPSKKPRLDDLESQSESSSKSICPFKHVKRTRVEEPGCEIGTNGRTFQVLDEVVGSDSDGEGDSYEFGKSGFLFVVSEVQYLCG